MIESRGLNQILHLIIGISLLLIPISLYLGLRPLCILAGLGFVIFLLDYCLYPFKQFYETFSLWLPILFEINILNGIYIVTKTIQFSTFVSILCLSVFVLRFFLIIYSRLLPSNNQYRHYIENKIAVLSKFFIRETSKIYKSLLKYFSQNDDSELEKFQHETLKPDEHLDIQHEHDETLNRFQQVAHENDHDLCSPIVSTIDCSSSSTPPIRRHHQRISLQQSELEPLSRTPITPAHNNLTKGKILHSTMNGSYTGPMTRNKIKTGPNGLPLSPLGSKGFSDFTFLVSKSNEDAQKK